MQQPLHYFGIHWKYLAKVVFMSKAIYIESWYMNNIANQVYLTLFFSVLVGKLLPFQIIREPNNCDLSSQCSWFGLKIVYTFHLTIAYQLYFTSIILRLLYFWGYFNVNFPNTFTGISCCMFQLLMCQQTPSKSAVDKRYKSAGQK